MTPILSAREVSVRYHGTDRWILEDAALEQFEGKTTAIIGPSGCGKSSFIHALCGLIPHTIPSDYRGSIELDGVEMAEATALQIAQNVAYVGQNPDAAVVTRSILDEVRFPLQNLCLERDEINQRALEALAIVGLDQDPATDPWKLSGGQRQRLALAAALAMKPRLLILDEPTSTIDSEGRAQFYDHLPKLIEQGLSVVVIDHDLDPLLPIVDHVMALDSAGALIASGPPRDVYLNHRAELEAEGIWLPRAVRRLSSSSMIQTQSGGNGSGIGQFGSDSLPAESDSADAVSLSSSIQTQSDGNGVGNGRFGSDSLQGESHSAPAVSLSSVIQTQSDQNRSENWQLGSESRKETVTSVEVPLTCEEAGIEIPTLSKVCTDRVEYYSRLESWLTSPDEDLPPITQWIDSCGLIPSDQSVEPILSAKKLHVPGRSPALDVELRPGDLVALVGPNGSGKSTTLSALAGIERFEAESATVEGRELKRGEHRVGYVFQNPEHQFVASTVEKELSFGGVDADTVDQLLAQFHLEDHRDRHPLTLSGGQSRRLSVATMVGQKHSIVLLDEPTFGQDWAHTQELMHFISELRDRGVAVMMATHDLELAFEWASHIIALPLTDSLSSVIQTQSGENGSGNGQFGPDSLKGEGDSAATVSSASVIQTQSDGNGSGNGQFGSDSLKGEGDSAATVSSSSVIQTQSDQNRSENWQLGSESLQVGELDAPETVKIPGDTGKSTDTRDFTDPSWSSRSRRSHRPSRPHRPERLCGKHR